MEKEKIYSKERTGSFKMGTRRGRGKLCKGTRTEVNGREGNAERDAKEES